MEGWWHRDVIHAGKLPLMLCFLAFVLTFLITRIITRLIRDGRGPFRDNVSADGTHIHHAVPGLVLLIVGAFVAVTDPAHLTIRCAAAVVVGIGVSLVLDEFALILHLRDDYWSAEGELSVRIVSLTAGCLGLALVGFVPFGVDNISDVELTVRVSAMVVLPVDLALVVTCVLKAKYATALFGCFVPPLALIGSIRLARPTSTWARHRYSPPRVAHATRRATHFDDRWDPLRTRWEQLVGGAPSPAIADTK